MARLYRYILKDDDGHAPCIDRKLLTLATCKPAIRSTAKVGDWVIGYMPKALGEGLVAWAGKVQQKLDHYEYEKTFRGRKDAAYRIGPAGEPERMYSDYHPQAEQMVRDLSAPVLVFDPKATWYFGDNPRQPPLHLDGLKAVGQGHRVNFRLPNDIEDLLEWLEGVSPAGILGRPRSLNDSCGSRCGSKKATRHQARRGC